MHAEPKGGPTATDRPRRATITAGSWLGGLVLATGLVAIWLERRIKAGRVARQAAGALSTEVRG